MDKRRIRGEVSVLIECTGIDKDLDQLRLDRFREDVLEDRLVAYAVVSHIPVALASLGTVVSASSGRCQAWKLFKFDLRMSSSYASEIAW